MEQLKNRSSSTVVEATSTGIKGAYVNINISAWCLSRGISFKLTNGYTWYAWCISRLSVFE